MGLAIAVLFVISCFVHTMVILHCDVFDPDCFVSKQCSNVERQHAVIEYDETEGCFVVQDLNSVHGTYVNECRVQNAAVRLASGDIIRFGYGILLN